MFTRYPWDSEIIVYPRQPSPQQRSLAILLSGLLTLALGACAQRVATTPVTAVPSAVTPAAITQPRTSEHALEDQKIDYGPLGGKSYLTDRELAALPRHLRVHFATNSDFISPHNAHIVAQNARFMEKFPHLRVLVEGNCDQRGTQEYNLALGWRRARAVKRLLIADGVLAARIGTTSFGKDNLLCNRNTPACWARNRRADLVYRSQGTRH